MPWSSPQLSDHALTLHRTFQNEPDIAMFPSLGTETGCRDLLHAMSSLNQFCPAATWLAKHDATCIGTVQALIQENGEGEIQNLGVLPSARGRGIGATLLALCLNGFFSIGCRKVVLEVSASNAPAVNLYRKFGFHPYKTVYLRAYDLPPSLGMDI